MQDRVIAGNSAYLKHLHEFKLNYHQPAYLYSFSESRVVKGHVTRRSDDPHGQGFGNVKTGFVSSTKLSFLQQAASSSLDRDGSPVPSVGSSSGGRSKGLRVTWAESPGSSRPASNLGWTMDGVSNGAAARAQTPPLAGEWASPGGSTVRTVTAESNQTSLSQQQSFGQSVRSAGAFGQSVQSTGAFGQSAQAAGAFGQSVLAAGAFGQSVPSAGALVEPAAANFMGSNKVTSADSFQSAQQMSFQSAQQMSSSTFQSSNQMSSSTFQSSKQISSASTSFSSTRPSPFPLSGKVHTFEAFPGLGEIENLCLEQGERVGK